MARFRMTGSVDPTSRIDVLEFAAGKTLSLGGEPQTMTDKQVEKARRYVVLEQVGEDGEPVAAPDDPPADKPPGANAGVSGTTKGN